MLAPTELTYRAILQCSAALLAFGIPSAAFAQDLVEEEAQPAADIPEEAAEGNEIVVTATKRQQTLQDVPVAVSVTMPETIERAHIRDLLDLTTVVPSLRVGQRQSSGATNFFIRGFGNGANNAGIEPSVGVFIDNVYRSRSAAQLADFPDVDRIEVLRGPQSTLFGKNASAGVVSIVTAAPKFEFGGNAEASYGNLDAVLLKGMVTGPLSESVAASLAAGYNKRDGFTKDLASGTRTNERNRWFVRGQLLFKPEDNLKVRLIGDYGKIDENCCAVVNLKPSATTLAVQALGGRVNPATDPFSDNVYYNFPSSNRIENYGLSGQVDYEIGPLTITSITAWRKTNSHSNQDSDFTSADILGRNEQDFGIKTFTQELRFSASFADKLNALLGFYYFNERIAQHNELAWGTQARSYANLVITGKSGGALTVPFLEGTFGALEGSPTKYLNQFAAQGQGLSERYRLKNDAISIFAQLDFKVADRLTLTGGLNFTHDSKRFRQNVQSTDVFAAVDFNNPAYAPLRRQLLLGGALRNAGVNPSDTAAVAAFASGATTAPIYNQMVAFANLNASNAALNPLNSLRDLQLFPPFLAVPNSVEPGKTSDNNLSWTARLSWDATDDVNVYVSYATGFKASSINLSRDSRPNDDPATRAAIVAAGLAQVNQSYGSRFAGPEKASVYELGVKADWGSVTANLALFKQDIRGFQSNIFTGTGFFLANAGKQSVWGVEFDGTARPVRGLSLGLSMTYLDPKYDSFLRSAFGDLTGKIRPSDVPPFSATITAEYDLRLANDHHVILHGDYHYESRTQHVEGLPGFVVKDPVTGAVTDFQPGLDAARPFTRTVTDLNASITYVLSNGLQFSAWGRNLLDDRNITMIFDSPAQSGSISGYPNQPRTYGVSALFRW